MSNYIDPKNDLAFKRIFGEHKHLCISLINSMLPLANPIVDIEYDTGELIPELQDLRNTVVDVRCTDTEGRQFLVEMQMYWSESFKSRVVLNASKAYVRQLDKAEEFKLLKPVYSLNFLNDIYEKSPEMENKYLHHYGIVNYHDSTKQIKGLEFCFIELPKYKPKNLAEKKLHDLWMLFLTQIDESTDEIPKELLENDLTKEAVTYAQRTAYTKAQLLTYDKYLDGIMIERSIISDSHSEGRAIGLEEGEAIGIEKGEAIGLEKGEAIGLEKGKVEAHKNTIANGIKAGCSIELISTMTGLTQEEVMKIIEELDIIKN